MYEREENAQFSLISYSKERRFRVFQTLPDSWKNKKLLQVLTWFLKLVYYRDYLGKIWRNSKIHDCQPILENYRHWLLSFRNLYLSPEFCNINLVKFNGGLWCFVTMACMNCLVYVYICSKFGKHDKFSWKNNILKLNMFIQLEVYIFI